MTEHHRGSYKKIILAYNICRNSVVQLFSAHVLNRQL